MSANVRPWDRVRRESSLVVAGLKRYKKWVFAGLGVLLLVDLLEVYTPLLLKRVVDALSGADPLHQALKWGVIFILVSLVQAGCRYGWRMFLIRASVWAGRDLRNRFVQHLFGLSPSFLDRSKVGDLMSLATNDVETVRMAIGAGLLTAADAIFYLVTAPVAMFVLAPKLALICFCPLLVIPWIVLRNEREIHIRFEKVQDLYAEISSLTQETIAGVRVIKAYAREPERLEVMRKAGVEYLEWNRKLARVQSFFGPSMDFLMSLGLVLLLWVGSQQVLGGVLTMGTLVAFQRYIQKLVWPMSAVAFAVSFYQRAATSSSRILDVLETQSEVKEPTQTELPRGAVPGGRWRTAGRVELENVSFRYKGSEHWALKGVSLVAEPGERIALMGRVGSGKSTLLSLVPRLYDVTEGRILVDGIDIRRWPLLELRAQMGYVSQETFLFSDSVVENIAFGLMRADAEKERELIQDSLRSSAVEKDLLLLPKSLETELGERGVNLSGGQKQRLTIARALVRDPAILLLDDALSSVDVNTENQILSGLRALRQGPRARGRTEWIAAHRVSTVLDADRIVLLERGEVVEEGSFSELKALEGGRFALLYDQQQGEREAAAEMEAYVRSLE